MKNKRIISPSIFALILICLAFPFITISCDTQEIGSLSGYNLAFGCQLEEQHVEGSFAGVMLIIIALIGIGLYFWKNKNRNLATAITGVLGMVFSFILKAGIDSKIASNGEDLSVHYKSGFVLTVLLFIAAACYNFYLYKIESKVVPQIKEECKFCPQCGDKCGPDDEFCSNCGEKF